MRVAVAADHAGFPLKDLVLKIVAELGHEGLDLGTHTTESVDYPDYAEKVGRAIQKGDADRGIILCGSGVGAAIAANKMVGVRAGLCHDTYSAHQSVEHDNANVLTLGARIIGPEIAMEIIRNFLQAEFSGEERHVRRLKKVKSIESGDLGVEEG